MARSFNCVDLFWRITIQILICLGNPSLLLLLASQNSEKLQAEVTLRNDSGVRIELGWINAKNDVIEGLVAVEPGSIFQLQSSEGHVFEVLEIPQERQDSSVGCVLKERINTKSLTLVQGCVANYFEIDSSAEQCTCTVFVVTTNFEVRKEKATRKQGSGSSEIGGSRDLLEQQLGLCRFDAKRDLTKAKKQPTQRRKIMSRFQKCIVEAVTPQIRHLSEEVEFESDLRRSAAIALENYTCTNDLYESTPDIEQRQWIYGKDRIPRVVHIKVNRPASRIHVIENFVSSEECEAMEDSVKGRLGRATTEDGKGGAHVSKNRKALQAFIEPEWGKEGKGDLIAGLSRRIYDYTNHELGLNITEHGQEPLMSIQYFGRGDLDSEPDRYTPHCDGKCEGRPFVHASRMATMVLYCTLPEKGGYTNFQHADVIVKPKAGYGIFFSYLDPNTNLTDDGLTTHSGCPVYEGEKKIITQWIRHGVSSEVSYEAYNSLEVLLSEDEDLI